MMIASFAALVAGLITGLVFRPLAIVPIALVFLVVLFTFGADSGLSIILAALIVIWVMNIGYLAGALLSYYVLGTVSGQARARSNPLARWFMR
jgi:hypothetical protein